MRGRLHDHVGPTSISIGRSLSRRAFLRSAAAVGLIAMGLPYRALSARRPAAQTAPVVAQQSGGDRIGDLAAALFYDLDEIHRFVTESIRYEPYAGILRGPEGTLAARAGNAVDQALLLAALLDASLLPYRFARGPMDPTAADMMLAAASSDAETFERQVMQAFTGAYPEELALESAIPPRGGAASVAELPTGAEAEDRARSIVEWARRQLSDTLEELETALTSAGVELPRTFSALPASEVDEHTWVQVARGTEWVDLDPSLPDSSPGTSAATVVDTPTELPDELRHYVRFEVIAEHLDGETLSTRTHMDLTAAADRLAGRPITFTNSDPAAIEELAAAVTPMEGVKSFVPMLLIGDEAYAGEAIAFGRAGALETDLLSGDSLFGGGAGPGGETTAQWLQATFTSPGREPVIVRRPLFDRFGPAARADGAPDLTSLRPVTEFVDDEGLDDIADARGAVWMSVAVGAPDPQAQVLSQGEDDNGVDAILAHGLHVFRELGDLVFAVPLGVRSYLDAPNLAAFSVVASPGADGQGWINGGLDIWHRSHGTLPVAGVETQASPTALADVLDHVVERVLGGDATPDPERTGVALPSVGAIFDASRDDGTELLVVREGADLAALEWPADAKATLARSLADGRLAVVPGAPVPMADGMRAGWWLVSTETGRVVDELDDGRGAEYIIVQAPGQISRETLRQTARDCLAGTITAAGLLITAYVVVTDWEKIPPWFLWASYAGGTFAGTQAYEPLKYCVKAAL